MNWDCSERNSDLPYILFEFQLDHSEREEILSNENAVRRKKFVEDSLSVAERERDEAESLLRDARDKQDRAEEDESKSRASVEARSTAAKTPEERSSLRDAREELRRLSKARKDAFNATRTAEDRTSAAQQRYIAARLHQISEEAIIGGRSPEEELLARRDEADAAFEAAMKKRDNLRAELTAAETEFTTAEATGDDNQIRTARSAVNTFTRAFQAAEKDLFSKSEALKFVQGLMSLSANTANSTNGFEALQSMNLSRFEAARTESVPERVLFQRRGVGGDLELLPLESNGIESVAEYISSRLPRVELIRPSESIPDSVTLQTLQSDELASFMRGIFYYAGLDRTSWDEIFTQTPRTLMQLDRASAQLNGALRVRWAQGNDLEFLLYHDSVKSEIQLQVRDPAIVSTFARASRRSSGFTHFFSLTTILHARQHESPASSYIWLFDEPGIYLHPDGQRDLMQVLETLADANQIVYTTHSLFLINKNHPTRHRLIIKDASGTRVDGKPFQGRWRPAVDALGLALPGTILFASHILLVEGDSDPVFINATLQKLADLGLIDWDLNPLSVMATGESRNTDAIIRILKEASPPPHIVHLLDSDSGGNDREEYIRATAKVFDVPVLKLPVENASIEDFLPAGDKLYVDATVKYLLKLTAKTESEITKAMAAKLKSYYGTEGAADEAAETAERVGLAKAVRKAAQEIAGTKTPVSPVGPAREFQLLLEPMKAELFADADLARALQLAALIQDHLKLPAQTAAQEQILA